MEQPLTLARAGAAPALALALTLATRWSSLPTPIQTRSCSGCMARTPEVDLSRRGPPCVRWLAPGPDPGCLPCCFRAAEPPANGARGPLTARRHVVSLVRVRVNPNPNPNPNGTQAGPRAVRACCAQEEAAGAPRKEHGDGHRLTYISPLSRLYLPYISPGLEHGGRRLPASCGGPCGGWGERGCGRHDRQDRRRPRGSA